MYVLFLIDFKTNDWISWNVQYLEDVKPLYLPGSFSQSPHVGDTIAEWYDGKHASLLLSVYDTIFLLSLLYESNFSVCS